MIIITRLTGGNHAVQGGTLPSAQKYAKRPVIVEAREMPGPFQVQTLEGIMEGKGGDFLITGIKGEMYPCDRDIFFASYEMVE